WRGHRRTACRRMRSVADGVRPGLRAIRRGEAASLAARAAAQQGDGFAGARGDAPRRGGARLRLRRRPSLDSRLHAKRGRRTEALEGCCPARTRGRVARARRCEVAMGTSEAYGSKFGDKFGLETAPVLITRALGRCEIAVTEVCSDNPRIGPT